MTRATSRVRAGALPRNVAALPSADHREKLRILEALLFAASEPLDEAKLAQPPRRAARTSARCWRSCARFYAGRGVNLVRVAGKWAFRTAEDLSYLLERYATQERRLSKAALETLSIIAYHQPVTRAEIEEIRGVTTSAGTLDVLLETGWVRPRGRRRAPGRPVTYGTTEAFLSHFGLEGIKDLPGLAELQRLGSARRQPAARLHRARADRRRRPDAGRAAARGGRGRRRGGLASRDDDEDGEDALPGDEDPDKS